MNILTAGAGLCRDYIHPSTALHFWVPHGLDAPRGRESPWPKSQQYTPAIWVGICKTPLREYMWFRGARPPGNAQWRGGVQDEMLELQEKEEA